MKKTLLLSCLFWIGISVFSQDFAAGFLDANKEKEADFSVVNITSSMLKMLAKENASDEDFLELIQQINGIRIITAETNAKTHYDSAKGLLGKQHEELVSVDKSAKSVRIFTKDNKNNVAAEVVMLMLENGKVTLVDILGKIDLNQLSNLSLLVDKME